MSQLKLYLFPMGKTRIVFLVNNLIVGGVSQVVIQLCNELPLNKFDIQLIVLSDDLEMEKNNPIRAEVQKHIIQFDFSSSYSLKTYILDSYIDSRFSHKSKAVLDKIVEISPDILHFHTLPRQLKIGILAKKQLPNTQLLFTDHSLRITKDAYGRVQRNLLAKAYRNLYQHYHLVAVSQEIHDYFSSYQLKHSDKLTAVLPNTIPIKHYERSDERSDTSRKVVYVSRINSRKGQDCLIKAWKIAQKKATDQLILIGPDETDGALKELAGNDESIVFTGSVADVKPYLNEASIGVFPSHKEGLPLSMLEMMAYELPMIVSDIPELTAIITHEVQGLHFRLNDEKSLATQLDRFLADDELRLKLGKAARKKVETLCNDHNPIEFYTAFYEQIMNSKQS